MSDRAFGAYNEFYIYATHICFFLNHEIWQAQTHNTIKQSVPILLHIKLFILLLIT